MNSAFLQDAVGEIRDDLILDAMQPAAKKSHKKRAWIAAAACLCLVLVGVLAFGKFPGLLHRQPSSSPVNCGVILDGQNDAHYLPFGYNDYIRFGILPEGTPHLSSEKLIALCAVTASDLGARLGKVIGSADSTLLGETAYRYQAGDSTEDLCVIAHDGNYEFFYRQEVLRQENAAAAYDLLDRAFGHDEIGNTLFPDDYAGAYIDGDRLVLLLTDTDENTLARYRAWVGEYADSLTFQKAEYSYRQLQDGLEAIRQELDDNGCRWWAYYVSETANTAVIEIAAGQGIDTRELATALSDKYGIPVSIEVLDGGFVFTTTDSN